MTKTALEITDDLYRRLRKRYDGQNGVVLLFNVGNGAGHGNSGWSDAIAMSTWPSKGLRILGFEVKATRSDWLRELDKPTKNLQWQTQCDEWYVVAPERIVKTGELPSDWGLLVPKGADGLRIASRCERAPREERSAPLELVAAVFRAAEAERGALRNADRQAMREEVDASWKRDLDRVKGERDASRAQYDRMRKAIGCTFFDAEQEIIRKAELVSAVDVDEAVNGARHLRARLEGHLKKVGEVLADLEGS